MTHKTTIAYDPDTGEKVLYLSDELCADMNLREGDDVEIWEEGGCVRIRKKDTRLYRVVLESKFILCMLVEAKDPDEAVEIAKDTDEYHQVHEGFKPHVVESITREHAKHLVAASDNKHMAEDPYFDRLIGRKK